ncbi:MAG: YdcF family protein [Chitinophaga sp.]|uniref:YdcF family protein n=1 Tax=Chitinophaga sp. TaxID=1869181 RepID=UPI0025C62378|nr:YdcF family protein [Chitinophaga sp.]MBV8251487.1 YdcF family protein [Chitinophaga sp.]
MRFKRRIIVICLVMAGFTAMAQTTAPDPQYTFLSGPSAVQDKNFYLFTLMEKQPVLSKLITTDSLLVRVGQQFNQRLARPASAAGNDVYAMVRPFQFSGEDVASVAMRLNQLLTTHPREMAPMMQAMRSSGMYQLYIHESDSALLKSAWQDAANGVNYILDAYTKNKGFRYPKIDSAAYWVKSPEYFASVNGLLEKLQGGDTHASFFFEPSLDLSLALLQLNHHDEAGRYEPLTKLNKDAYQKIKKTKWGKYPYSAILILGAGPGNIEHISDAGKNRCKSGVADYKSGKAPFIIVSGGHVHPFLTPFAEGIEMKKYLVDSLGVPAYAVIVDPYARHTTTNIRNAVRIMFRSGIPMDKRMLCVSDNMHLTYITTKIFDMRCRQELGYVPMKESQSVSETSISFFPDLSALQADSRDPLDP